MTLLSAGYWPTTYWAENYWAAVFSYWVVFGGGAGPGGSFKPIWRPRRGR